MLVIWTPLTLYALGDNEHKERGFSISFKGSISRWYCGELCWSDDPDYTVGYVACNGVYHRITNMKEFGSNIGGRVFLCTV